MILETFLGIGVAFSAPIVAEKSAQVLGFCALAVKHLKDAVSNFKETTGVDMGENLSFIVYGGIEIILPEKEMSELIRGLNGQRAAKSVPPEVAENCFVSASRVSELLQKGQHLAANPAVRSMFPK